MSEQTCPHCGKPTLTEWEKTPLTIIYICSACGSHLTKQTRLGKTYEIALPVVGAAASIVGAIAGLSAWRRKK